MNWIRQHFRQIIYVSFLFPILLVAFVSIAHVTKWYGIGNPISWAIYLSVAVEIAALSSLAAIVGKMGRNVYFPFILVTIIQFIGNIFYSYQYIQIGSQSFKDWVDLVSPLVTFMGIEPNDMIGHKRLLSFLLGGLLPIISLSFLGLLVKFEEKEVGQKKENPAEPNIPNPQPPIEAQDLMAEVSRVRLSKDDLDKLEDMLRKAKPRPPSYVNDTEEPVTEEQPYEGDVHIDIPKDVVLPSPDYTKPDPVIETLPPPAEKREEWIPALGDAEVMDMLLNEYERRPEFEPEDLELMGSPMPTPQPITPTPEQVSEKFNEDLIELVENPNVNKRIYPANLQPLPSEEVDIPPEVTDYVAPQKDELKKK